MRAGSRAGTTAIALTLFTTGLGVLRHLGLVGISNDDAARALLAWSAQRAPSLDPTRSSWLPAHTWELSALLRLAPDPDLTPRLLSWASACAAVALTVRAAHRLGASRAGLAASLLTLLAWRWTLLPAAAGAVPELPCAAWLLAGVALLDDERPTLAGLCVTVACGHRYEAWFAGAALALHETITNPRRAWRFALTASLMPLAWLAINHTRNGDAFDFVHRVEAFRRHEGPLPTMGARLVRYPWLALRELAWPLGAAAFAWRTQPTLRDAPARRRVVAAVAVFAMLVWGDLRGGGPTHHAARALVLVAWLVAPLAACVTTRLRSVWSVAALAAALVVAPRRAELTDGVHPDAVCAGDTVHATLTDGAPWFLEASRQDFLWVEVRSRAPDGVRVDRAYGSPVADEGSRARGLAEALVAVTVRETPERAMRDGRWHIAHRCGAYSVWTRAAPTR